MSEATGATLTVNRHVEHRFILSCETLTPIHVGSGEPGATTDADVCRRTDGEYVIPGTSLAGALRNVVERLSGTEREKSCIQYQDNPSKDKPCGCRVCKLFGDVQPRENDDLDNAAQASRLRIFDAEFTKPRLRTVDSVGIHRRRRSARDARKFDYRQILPDSKLSIEVRGEGLSDQEIEWVSAGLRIIATGQVGLGGRTARGNGFLKADAARCHIDRRSLDNPEHLLDSVLLCNNDRAAWKTPVAKSLSKFPGAALSIPNRISTSFFIATAPDATLLISDPMQQAATGFDAAQRKLTGLPELPASSLAGVLRSGAERIVRSLGGIACDPNDKHCPAPKKGPADNDTPFCLPCRLFGNVNWSSRLTVRVIACGQQTHLVPFDHVAIDRFSGGAADQKKFDAMAVARGMFKVDFVIDRVADRGSAQWMIGLLTLVLRDLHQGRLTVGRGSSKGHGRVQLAGEPRWQLPEEWKDLSASLSSCIDALASQLNGSKSS